MDRCVSMVAAHVLVALALGAPTVTAQQGRGTAAEVENPTTITAITTENRDGTTVVIIIADDEFKPFGWRYYEIAGDEPRAVLRVRGIVRAFDADVLSVHGPLLERIRVGHHPDHLPPELHLVFDLTSPRVMIRNVEAKGKRLEVTLGLDLPGGASPTSPLSRATPSPTSLPSGSSASPTPASTPAPTATPSSPPTRTPTATATASPIATATETPTPAPTAAPTATPTTAPVSTPTPTPSRTAPPMPSGPSTPTPFPGITSVPGTVVPAAATPRQASPTPRQTRPPRRPATTARLLEVEPQFHADGTTVVRIRLDEPVRYERYRLIEISHDPPRAVLSLFGVEAAGLPRVTQVDRGGLESVRIVAAPNSGRDVHVLLSFSSPGSTVREIVVRGQDLEVQIGAPPG